MKAKTNLELFKNEMIYNLEHGRCESLYVAMVAIYVRESPSKVINYENILNWFSDVPRETFEVTAEMYAFLKAYVKDELVCDEAPLDYSVCTSVLINIGIIPKKYSKWPLKEFIKIIRVEENKKK